MIKIRVHKQSKNIPAILVVFGIIFISGALYFLIHGIISYQEQLTQREWIVTTATVTDVRKHIKSHGPKSHNHRIIYDIDYQYEVSGTIYANTIYGDIHSKECGENFNIKYDPLSPGNSTYRIKPDIGFIVTGIIGFVVCGAIGYRMLSMYFHKPKKRRKAGTK